MVDILYDGKWMRMVRSGRWEFVQRKNICGIVGIVAVTDEGRLLLVEQYRPPVGRRVIEVPAGLAGDLPGSEHEDLAAAACRELEEETGYRAGKMDLLCSGAPSAGLCGELISLYRAAELVKVAEGGGDHTEDIEVHEVPLNEVRAFLAEREQAGVVVDLKVYAALYFAEAT